MKLRGSSITILALLVVSAGCRSTRPIISDDAASGSDFPNHSVEEIQNRLQQHPVDLNAYSAESALSIRSPIRSGSFAASVQHVKNDSLLISISPGLGIVAVRALVTPDSFYVHDRINRELTVGGIQDMQKMLPLPVSSEMLYASMLGLIEPDPALRWQLSQSGNYYLLKDESGRISYMVDPVLWRVVRYEERSAAGELVEERTFSEFESFEGMYLPRRLTFRRPGDETSASLFYRKLSVNPSDMKIEFQVSSSVPRISFR